ncbi:hypothetical protein GQ457_17G003470 [Hibiscus cannabinus]
MGWPHISVEPNRDQFGSGCQVGSGYMPHVLCGLVEDRVLSPFHSYLKTLKKSPFSSIEALAAFNEDRAIVRRRSGKLSDGLWPPFASSLPFLSCPSSTRGRWEKLPKIDNASRQSSDRQTSPLRWQS